MRNHARAGVALLTAAVLAAGCSDALRLRSAQTIATTLPARVDAVVPQSSPAAPQTTQAPVPATIVPAAPVTAAPPDPAAPPTAPERGGSASARAVDDEFPPQKLAATPFCTAVSDAYTGTALMFRRIDVTASQNAGADGWRRIAGLMQAAADAWKRAGTLAPPEMRAHTGALTTIFAAFAGQAGAGNAPDPDGGDNPMDHLAAVVASCGGSMA